MAPQPKKTSGQHSEELSEVSLDKTTVVPSKQILSLVQAPVGLDAEAVNGSGKAVAGAGSRTDWRKLCFGALRVAKWVAIGAVGVAGAGFVTWVVMNARSVGQNAFNFEPGDGADGNALVPAWDGGSGVFPISETVAGDQDFSLGTQVTDGGVPKTILMWREYGKNGMGTYTRSYNKADSAITGEGLLSSVTSLKDVATLKNGNVIAVLGDKFRIYTPDLQVVTGEIDVSDDFSALDARVIVTDDGFVLVFEDYNGSDRDSFLRGFDLNGQPFRNETLISMETVNHQGDLSGTQLQNGDVPVAWVDTEGPGQNKIFLNIFRNLSDPARLFSGADVHLSSGATGTSNYAVSLTSHGNKVLGVWFSDDAAAPPGQKGKVLLQRVNGETGEFIREAVVVASLNDASTPYPKIKSFKHQEKFYSVVAWRDYITTESYRISVQLLDFEDNLIGDAIIVDDAEGYFPESFSILKKGNDEFQIIYTSRNQRAVDSDKDGYATKTYSIADLLERAQAPTPTNDDSYLGWIAAGVVGTVATVTASVALAVGFRLSRRFIKAKLTEAAQNNVANSHVEEGPLQSLLEDWGIHLAKELNIADAGSMRHTRTKNYMAALEQLYNHLNKHHNFDLLTLNSKEKETELWGFYRISKSAISSSLTQHQSSAGFFGKATLTAHRVAESMGYADKLDEIASLDRLESVACEIMGKLNPEMVAVCQELRR